MRPNYATIYSILILTDFYFSGCLPFHIFFRSLLFSRSPAPFMCQPHFEDGWQLG